MVPSVFEPTKFEKVKVKDSKKVTPVKEPRHSVIRAKVI